jgi:hypothetical protein
MARPYAERNLCLLKTICKCKKSGIVKHCDRDGIISICECADNLLKGRVTLTSQQKKRLARHKTAIKKLANTRIGWKRKRVILQRGGGLLTAILGVAVPALISLFSK